LEEFIRSLSELNPVWVYAAILVTAYIENIIPPFPSDLIVVFGGSLVAVGQGHFALALLSATVGSTLGFMTMYSIGKWFGKAIIESGRLKFVSLGAVHSAERWFGRYGYWLVIINRFLAGTRAVVSFFAGISNLDPVKSFSLSFVSALAWNFLLVYGGYALGKNWESVGYYLTTYSQIVTAIVLFVVLVVVLRYVFLRRTKSTPIV
jgi:membrane protein DedA with SNARE-associated domain